MARLILAVVLGVLLVGEKLTIYNLSEMGVDVDKSPTHVSDGEMLQAQNAMIDVAGNRGGLRKRLGMSKLNSSALNGGAEILGMFNVPLADPQGLLSQGQTNFGLYGGGFDAATGSGALWSFRQANGSVTQASDQPNPAAFQKFSTIGVTEVAAAARIAALGGRLYYPGREGVGQDYTIGSSAPTLRRWDGTTESVVLRVPYNPALASTTFCRAIGDILAADNKIYFVAIDVITNGSARSRIFEFDPDSESITMVGNAWGTAGTEIGSGNLIPLRLAWHFGRLWAASYATSGAATVHYIRPGIDDTWTLDETLDASEQPTDMISVDGRLVVSVRGTANRVHIRGGTGTWTDVTVTFNAPLGVGTTDLIVVGMAVLDDYQRGSNADRLVFAAGIPNGSALDDQHLYLGGVTDTTMAGSYFSHELIDDNSLASDDRLYQAHFSVLGNYLQYAGIVDPASGTAARAVEVRIYELPLTTVFPVADIGGLVYSSTVVGRPWSAILGY